MAVKCRMCGEDADLLLKVAYNGELNACCLGEGKAHESGLCWGCDSDGASALPWLRGATQRGVGGQGPPR